MKPQHYFWIFFISLFLLGRSISVNGQSCSKEELQAILNTYNDTNSVYYLVLNYAEDKEFGFYEEIYRNPNDKKIGINFVRQPRDQYFTGYIDGVAFSGYIDYLEQKDYESINLPVLELNRRMIEYAVNNLQCDSLKSGVACICIDNSEQLIYQLHFGFALVDFSSNDYKTFNVDYENIYTIELNEIGYIKKITTPYNYSTIEYLSINHDTPILIREVEDYTKDL